MDLIYIDKPPTLRPKEKVYQIDIVRCTEVQVLASFELTKAKSAS